MRLLILPFSTLLAAGACQPERIVYLQPQIPAETLTPCPISERQAETYRDLAVLATEHLTAARCANGKIETMAEILKETPDAPQQ